MSVAELIRRALAEPPHEPPAGVGVLHTAKGNAAGCAIMLAAGDTPETCWRFGILQTLDDYMSTFRRGGPALAAGVFADEPDPTGSAELDAAFAALAEHLARRDGWTAPAWVSDPARRADGWYPDVPPSLRAEAERDSPPAFKARGILITSLSLSRA
jgi:hypothetical protein